LLAVSLGLHLYILRSRLAWRRLARRRSAWRRLWADPPGDLATIRANDELFENCFQAEMPLA